MILELFLIVSFWIIWRFFQSKFEESGYLPNIGLWRSWSLEYTANPYKFSRPSTIEEVVDIVKNATNNDEKVKVVGSSHSWSNVASPSSKLSNRWHLVSLEKMSKILNIDEENQLVVVQPGIKVGDFHHQLRKHGLATSNSGSVPDPTLGGVLGTGTHGTGITMGILSTSVVSMKIVMGTGEVLNLSETNNRELFRCCQLAIGSLGIIVELTIRVQQSFDLLENNSQVDFSSFLKMETLKPALQKNKYLKLWCLPYKPYIARLWVQNEEKRSPKYDTLFNRIHHYLDRDFLTPYVFMPLLNTIIEMHKFSPKLYFFATFYRIVGPLFASSKNLFGKSFEILYPGYLPLHVESEYCVPIEKAAHYMVKISELVEKKKLRAALPTEVRFVKADEIPLSPAFGRDSCYITVGLDQGVTDPIWKEIESLFIDDLEARPHWGKLHLMTANDLSKRYPLWNLFKSMRDKYDPERIFTNDYVSRVLDTNQ